MRLYTADFCEPCQRVKEFIGENNIQVEIIDTDNVKLGDLLIPLLVDGNIRIRGEEDIISYLKNRMIL